MISVLAYAGNRVDSPGTPREAARFPFSQVDAVRRRTSDVLKTEVPDAVIGAGAAGGDLIVIEEALALDIDVHLILPLTPSAFREASVSDRGEEWGATFDRVIEALPPSNVRHRTETVPDLGVFRDGNAAILASAIELASGGGVVALAISGVPASSRPRVTDHFVDLAQALDLRIIRIDPLNPHAA